MLSHQLMNVTRQLMNVTRHVFKRYILYEVYSIYNANPLIISLNYASFTTNKNPFIFYIKKEKRTLLFLSPKHVTFSNTDDFELFLLHHFRFLLDADLFWVFIKVCILIDILVVFIMIFLL